MLRVFLLLLAIVSGCASSAVPVRPADSPDACSRDVYPGRVVAVYDGDTYTVDVDLGLGVSLTAQKIRLVGVDTPELRGAERPEGLRVRDLVRSRLLDREVLLALDGSRGKYGRWLADVLVDGSSTAAWLLRSGLARPYGR